MKKLFTTLFLAAFCMVAYAQDLEEILENHFEVVGQETVLKTKSMSIGGKMSMGPMTFPIEMHTARGNKLRMNITFQGSEMIQALNGDKGWMKNPFTGGKIEELPEDQVKGFKDQADMDGDLWDYAKKGSKLELLDDEDFEGTEVHVLHLTKEDGDEVSYYLDTDSYVVLKSVSKSAVPGVETKVVTTTIFSDYKEVEGMIIAHSMTMETEGVGAQQGGGARSLTIEEVKINPDFEKGFFAMPEKEAEEKGATGNNK